MVRKTTLSTGFFYYVAVIVIQSLVGFNTLMATGEKTFDIIEITDFHGALEDTGNPPFPVVAVLARNVQEIQTANPDRTLVVGGGDFGTALSNLLHGVPVMQVTNDMGIEVC
jgi:2',3'-cyclic-nucleotide 2'-phosphodiesterase/3'-nucleotidase